MHRVDTAGNNAGFFQDGDPSLGIFPTQVGQAWHNDVQENIIQVILAAGIALEKGNTTQLRDAIATLYGGGVQATRQVATSGLATGGGDLTANRTITVTAASDAEVITGTEAAKAITPAGLSARTATTARTGLVELATGAEAQGWADAARALTPATLAAAFQGAHQAFALPGHQNLPGGMILKFGLVNETITSDGVFTPVAFDTAFPTACVLPFVCNYNPSSDSAADSNVSVVSWDANGFQPRTNSTSGVAVIHGFIWLALGY